MSDTLTGEVRAVVYHNEENGYIVARVASKDEPSHITVVGVLGSLTPGESVELHGRWKQHPKFGRQFEADFYERVRPATEAGLSVFEIVVHQRHR